MKSEPTNRGVKPTLKSLSIEESKREWELMRLVVGYAEWILPVFILGIYLLAPELRAKGPGVYIWLAIYLTYNLGREVLARTMTKSYETSFFQMVRIQIMLFLGSGLLILTGGTGSYFWFIYLWPLFASTFYFSEIITWGIYGEVAVLYFAASLLSTRDLASVNVAQLLANLSILLVLTAVLRYLMESIKRYRATESKLRYSEVFRDIQEDIDTAIDLQEVLDKVISRAVESVGARDGSLMLIDEKNELRFRARHGRSLATEEKKRTFKLGEGIAGWVAQEGKLYICHDTRTDHHFVPIITGVPIRSLVSVPIISHNVVLGVINVDSEKPNRFSATDSELLATLADQMAVAIERAALLDGLKRIGELPIGYTEELYQSIVDVVYQLTRCPIALWRLDEAGTHAQIVAFKGIRPEHAQKATVNLDGSVTGKAIRQHEIIQVPDIQAEPDFQNKEEATREGWQSMLAVPLLAGPEYAIGTLSIYSPIKKEFSRWELNLLDAFASQTGSIIQNAQRLQTIRRLNRLGRSLSSLQETLEQTAQAAVQVLGANVVDVYQYRADIDKFVLPPVMAGERQFPNLVSKQISSDDVVFKIAHSGNTIYASEAQSHPLLAGSWEGSREGKPSERFVVREKIISSAAVPLKVGEEVLGVIFAGYRQKRDLENDPDLCDSIQVFANQAAISIQNARLLENEQKLRGQAETLREISVAISSITDIEQVADKILDELGKVIEYRKASMQLIHGDSRTQIAGRGFTGQAPPSWALRSISQDRLINRIVSGRKPFIVKDLSDPSQAPDEWEFRTETAHIKSWASVPLVYREEVIGLLTIDHDQPGYYTEAIEGLLTLFANQAALAINNARLVQRLNLLQQASAKISTTLKLDEILPMLVQSAMNLTNTSSGVVHVIENPQDMTTRSYGHPDEFGHPSPRISEGGYTHFIIQNKKQQIVQDTLTDIRANPDIRGKGIRSFVGTPLKLESERVVGVLYVNDASVRQFTDEELALLQTLADQAAIAIANAKLFKQVEEERRERVEAIREIGFGITAGPDLDAILDSLLEKTLRLMREASVGEIWLLDEKKQKLKAQAVRGHVETTQVAELGIGEGIVGWVAQSKQPYLAKSVEQDSHFVRRLAGTQSELAVPMFKGEQLVGVLNIEHPRPGAFVAEDIPLLGAIASQVVVALENARLFQEINERATQLERLQKVTAAISAEPTALDTVLHSIVGSIDAIFQNTACEIRLYDSKKGTFTERITADALEEYIDYAPRDKGTSKHVMQTKQPFYAENTFAQLPNGEPAIREQVQAKGIQAVATLPLVAEDAVIGIMYVNWAVPHTFSRNDQQILELFTGQAAIAIKNARLFEETQRLNNQLQLLNNASQVFSSTLNPHQVLKAVLEEVGRLLNAGATSVWLVDPETGGLICQHSTSPVAATLLGWQLEPGQGLAGWIVRTGKSALVPDARSDERHFGGVSQQTGFEVRSLIGVPLQIKDKTIGVIEAVDPGTNRFDAADQTLLESLSSSAAAAIENAQLYEQRITDIGALQEINAAITMGTQADIPAMVAQKAQDLTQADYGSLWMVKDQHLVLAKIFGRVAKFDEQPTLDRLLIDEHSIIGYVAQTGEPYKCPDTSTDPHYKEWYGEIKSNITAPLLLGNHVIGTLAAESTSLNAFSDYHLRLLKSLADQATIAIENARLFEQQQEDLKQIQALYEIGQALSAQLDYKKVLKLILERAQGLVPFEHGSVTLIDKSSSNLVAESALGLSKGIGPVHTQVGEGITGWVAKHGRSLCVADVHNIPHVPNALEQPSYITLAGSTQSELCVPLKVKEEIIGVLNVESPKLGAYDNKDQRQLEILANQAAIAIANARLYQQRIKDIAALQEINSVIGSEELEGIFNLIAQKANELTDATYSTLWMLDKENHCLKTGAVHGREAGSERLPLDEKSINGHVALTQKPYLCNDISNDPHYTPWYNDIQSNLTVPLLFRGELIGTLHVESTHLNVFTEYQRDMLQSLGDQAAIAIENARLYKDLAETNFNLDKTNQDLAQAKQNLEHRVRELVVLTEIGRTVSTLGIDQILDLVYEQTSKIIDLRNAQVQVAFYDETKDEVSFPLAIEQDNGETIDVVRWGKREALYREEGENEVVEPFVPRVWRDPPGLTEHVIQTQQPLLIAEDFEQRTAELGIKAWPRFGRMERPTHSWLGVPMMVSNRVVGVISIQSLEQERAFDEGQQRLLATVTSQAAIAIENARLYRRVEERRIGQLEALQKIYENIIKVGIKSVDEILNVIFSATAEIIDLRDAMFYVAFYDEAKEEVSFGLAVEQDKGQKIDEIRWGKRENGEEVKQWTVRARREPPGLTEYVIRKAEPVLIFEKFEEWARAELKVEVWSKIGKRNRSTRSWLGVPMIVGSKVIGMISLQSLEQEHAFDQGNMELLAAVANQAAIAIQNAGLLEEQKRIVQRLQAVHRVGRQVTSILDLQPLIQYAAQSIHDTFGHFYVAIMMLDPTLNELTYFAGAGEAAGNTPEDYRQKLGNGMIGWVAQTGEHRLANDVLKDSLYIAPYLTDVRAELDIPIKVGGKVIGVLDLQSRYVNGFREDISILEILADQLAIAIVNARLYQEARSEAIASKQLATLGTAIATLQHRISNSFDLIIPNVDRLRRRFDPPDETVAEILEIIERNARYTSDIIRRIQEPLREIARQDVNVNAVLNEAVAKARERWPTDRPIEVNLFADESIPVIQASIGQVAEVFQNLVDNAGRAMQEGGQLKVVSKLENDKIYVRVQDTGPGIPPEIQARLFNKPVPFKEPGKGAGLGLWLSQLILQSMGGDVKIEKTDSSGTTMLVQIPVPKGG